MTSASVVQRWSFVTVAASAGLLAAVLAAGARDAPAAAAQACIGTPSGIVAWFPAEGDANDIRGASDGTLVGGAGFATGKVGQAFALDGVDDRVQLAVVPALDFGTGDFTIETWLNLNTVASDQTIFQKSAATPVDPSYFIEFDAPNMLRFGVFESVANRNDLTSGALSITAGSWFHFAAVRSGNTSTIYLNGVSVAQQTAGTNVNTGTGGQTGIGSTAGQSRFVNGLVDEFSFYNRALSQSEIAAIANADSFGKCPQPPAVESFFLPKSVIAKFNTKDATKSTLVTSGFFDTGAGAADLTKPATLSVGGLPPFNIPALAAAGGGKSFTYSAAGISFSIFPNKTGSSRARFKLKATGDLTGKVDPSGDLELEFTQGAIDGHGTVRLTNGKYTLNRVRGALLAPNLFLLRSNATLKGPGKDALSAVVGLATGGVTPAGASDFTIGFGGQFSRTILATQFVKKGDKFQFAGSAGGITKVVLDYARETIAITGKGLDLGAFAQGGNPVLVSVGLGTDARSVRVRMGHKGSAMKY